METKGKSKEKEIEKKFLIQYPSPEILKSIPEADKSRIVQTYLLAPKGFTLRVRSRSYADGVKYTKTIKKRINDMSCFEDEQEISAEEYQNELKKADPERRPIIKDRLLLRNGRHIFEIDIYPFWSDRAIMEVELSSEDEEYTIPQGIEIIRDVTGDKRYKNTRLAKDIPED